MLSYAFVVLEEQGAACEFALDDIHWESGVTTGAGDEPASPVGQLQLLANAPNPINAMTENRFDLPAGRLYRVTIHDLAGRQRSGPSLR